MRTISQEEFAKQYGTEVLGQVEQPKKKGGYISGVGDAFKAGLGKVKQGIDEAKPIGGKGLGGVVTGVGKILGGATEAITSPLAPPMQATVGRGVEFAADRLSETEPFKGYGRDTVSLGSKELLPEKIAGTVGDYANAAGLAAGFAGGSGAASAATRKATAAPKAAIEAGENAISKGTNYVKSTVRDVVPTKQRMINHQVARALDLTPGDLNAIFRSTKNDVGEWVSKNNLIRENKEATQSAIEGFFKQNYDQVRAEIAKDPTTYAQYQVPRYVDALKQIQQKVKGVPGLEKVDNQVQNLLIKQKLKLSDVQTVKELMDDHFNLYKVTGDVAEGVAKEGLANIRKDLQAFIEKKVKETTGADIREMNRNVSTAKSLTEAITTRSQRGLTRSNINHGDLALAFFGFSNPVIGIPAFIIKKIYETPTMRLRLARYLDGLNDAQAAKVRAQMEKGIIPQGVKNALNNTASGIANKAQQAAKASPFTGKTEPAADLPDVTKGTMFDSSQTQEQRQERMRYVIDHVDPTGGAGAVTKVGAKAAVTAADVMKDSLLQALKKPQALPKPGKTLNLDTKLADEVNEFIKFLEEVPNPTMNELNKGLELVRLMGGNAKAIADDVLKHAQQEYTQLRDAIGRFTSNK